jgi:dihydrofolate reductase
MRISLIVAVSENHVIGRDDDLPWRLSSDLRRFKKTTMGHHMIMGRKTYDSIGRPLPGRTSVVLTRQENYQAAGGVRIARSWEQAIQECQGDDEVFVIGGEQVYRIALPHANRLYLTEVHCEIPGDAHFPDWDADAWSELDREFTAADERNEISSTYRVLQRCSETPRETEHPAPD